MNYKKMFKCDTYRISKVGDTLFLIIGYKRNTKDDKTSQWYKNEKPIDFDYVEEKVIASGKNRKELNKSAKHYKSLLGKTWDDKWEEYLDDYNNSLFK